MNNSAKVPIDTKIAALSAQVSQLSDEIKRISSISNQLIASKTNQTELIEKISKRTIELQEELRTKRLKETEKAQIAFFTDMADMVKTIKKLDQQISSIIADTNQIKKKLENINTKKGISIGSIGLFLSNTRIIIAIIIAEFIVGVLLYFLI